MIKWITNLALALCLGSREFAVMLISCVPLIELKGAIPIGTEYFGLSFQTSFWLSFAGSSLVCIPLMLILKPIHNWAKQKPNSLVTRIEDVFKEKAKGLDSKKNTLYKIFGIFAFTAIPLPLTGAYTASVVAVLIGLNFFPAVLAITVGNLTAGAFILLLTALLGTYVNLFLYILFAFALVFFTIFVYKIFRRATPKKIIKGDI